MYLYFKDFKQILPSIIILVVGLAIMIMFIPYAFMSVIKQLQREQMMMMKNETSSSLE